MPAELIPYVAQFGFAGLMVVVYAYVIVPEMRRQGRRADRAVLAQMLQLAESELLGEKLKKMARDTADEIKGEVGKDDLT